MRIRGDGALEQAMPEQVGLALRLGTKELVLLLTNGDEPRGRSQQELSMPARQGAHGRDPVEHAAGREEALVVAGRRHPGEARHVGRGHAEVRAPRELDGADADEQEPRQEGGPHGLPSRHGVRRTRAHEQAGEGQHEVQEAILEVVAPDGDHVGGVRQEGRRQHPRHDAPAAPREEEHAREDQGDPTATSRTPGRTGPRTRGPSPTRAVRRPWRSTCWGASRRGRGAAARAARPGWRRGSRTTERSTVAGRSRTAATRRST